MVTHSSVLACRIPGTGEPGGLPSMGSHRGRHDWSDLAAAAVAMTVAKASTLTHKVPADLLPPQQKCGPCAPFLNGAVWMSIWLSWVQGLLISPSRLFFHFKNIPLHSSSFLFLSGTESKCGFNEVLMLFFFFCKCISAGLDNWHSLSFFCLFSAWNIKEPWSFFLL